MCLWRLHKLSDTDADFIIIQQVVPVLVINMLNFLEQRVLIVFKHLCEFLVSLRHIFLGQHLLNIKLVERTLLNQVFVTLKFFFHFFLTIIVGLIFKSLVNKFVYFFQGLLINLFCFISLYHPSVEVKQIFSFWIEHFMELFKELWLLHVLVVGPHIVTPGNCVLHIFEASETYIE